MSYHTPEGSEVDELEYANRSAERLFFLSYTNQVNDKQYTRNAEWLDRVPGAGEYFRCMNMREYSETQLVQWAKFGSVMKEHAAWTEERKLQESQSAERGWIGKQWVKKGNKMRYQKLWR
jgi:hypothetical protein